MTNSNNLAFTFIEQGQAQKEVTANNALRRIDAILNTSALDKDLTAPPSVINEGDLYIVASSATGDWAGQDGKIAWYTSSAWVFITPQEGMSLWLADEDTLYVYNGASWTTLTSAVSFQNLALLGINTTADSTNKLAVASGAILFTNLGSAEGDVQIKINKFGVGDTNSFLFQTNFSGRAEFGCIGDDDFTFKTSPDNFSSSFEALKISSTDGWSRFLGFNTAAATELTIATGAVTVTQTCHKIDTESDAASDDLDTISGGSEGKIIILEPADDARTVVVKNASGNIRNSSGADVSLDAYGQSWMGRYDGSNWIQIGGKA